MMPTETRSSAIYFFKALENVGDELDELNSLQQINKCNKREVLLYEERVDRAKQQLNQLQIQLDTFKILAIQDTEMNEEKKYQLQKLQDEQKNLEKILKDKYQICQRYRQKLRTLVGDDLFIEQGKQIVELGMDEIGQVGQVGSIKKKIQYLQAELDENQLKIIEKQSLIDQYAFLNNQVKLLEAMQAANLLQQQKKQKSEILKQLESQMLKMTEEQLDLRSAISLLKNQINQLQQNKQQNEWNANQLEHFLEGILDDNKRQMKILSDQIKAKKQVLDLAQQQLTKVQIEDEQFQDKIKQKKKQLGTIIKNLESAKEKLLKLQTPKQNGQIQQQFNQIWKRYVDK